MHLVLDRPVRPLTVPPPSPPSPGAVGSKNNPHLLLPTFKVGTFYYLNFFLSKFIMCHSATKRKKGEEVSKRKKGGGRCQREGRGGRRCQRGARGRGRCQRGARRGRKCQRGADSKAGTQTPAPVVTPQGYCAKVVQSFNSKFYKYKHCFFH